MNRTVGLLGGAIAALGIALAGCGGTGFESGSPLEVGDAASDAGAGDESVMDGAAPVDAGSPEASPDAADAAGPSVFVLCNTPSASFGCGSGWLAFEKTLPAAERASIAEAGAYFVTMMPPSGPPVYCDSTAAPVSVHGVCPWTISSSNESAWVPCTVTAATPDGGVTLGSSDSCDSNLAP